MTVPVWMLLGFAAWSLLLLLSAIVLAARIAQSLAHVCLMQTNTVAAIRFALFFIQIVSFIALIVLRVRHAWPPS